MNIFLRSGRKLAEWMIYVRPSPNDRQPLKWVRKKISYKLLQPISKCLKNIGRRKYLCTRSITNASWEIREYLFRKLQLYVECYLANIAYRYFDDAPRPMPPSTEVRRKWGLKVLEHFATERESKHRNKMLQSHDEAKKEDYAELARIYRWIVYDREDWANPFWGKIPEELDFEECFLHVPEEKEEEWRFYTEKAERLDRIQRKRIKGRARRLFERKHVLDYD